jgi:hypothetical protein
MSSLSMPVRKGSSGPRFSGKFLLSSTESVLGEDIDLIGPLQTLLTMSVEALAGDVLDIFGQMVMAQAAVGTPVYEGIITVDSVNYPIGLQSGSGGGDYQTLSGKVSYVVATNGPVEITLKGRTQVPGICFAAANGYSRSTTLSVNRFGAS